MNMILAYKDFSDGVDFIVEKNVPKNPSLWQRCKEVAKGKYDVWPSAYACGYAAKLYKKRGGKWRKSKQRRVARKKR